MAALLTHSTYGLVIALRDRAERKIGHNTYAIRQDSTTIIVKFHNSIIVELNYKQRTIKLYNDGYFTSTTKERLNQFIPAGYRIFQQAGQWYVYEHASGINYIWSEGITFTADHTNVLRWKISNTGTPAENDNRKALRRKIEKYVTGFVKSFLAGEVEAPGAGDCFYCQSVLPCNDLDHYESHLEESYFVPSLLLNAIQDSNSTGKIAPITRQVVFTVWSGDKSVLDIQTFREVTKRDLTKTLRSFLYGKFEVTK